MQAPVRVPLNILKGHNQLSPTIESDIKPKPGKIILAAKPFPPELLADFKRAISGSKLSKVGLIEVLKKEYIPLAR